MDIKINDRTVTLDDGATLADALAAVNAPASGIATALNGEVVPATRRATTILNDGDSILIIKAFYGG